MLARSYTMNNNQRNIFIPEEWFNITVNVKIDSRDTS